MKTENTKPSNSSAFPSDVYLENGEKQKGMTLRDYFANSAMLGLLTARMFAPSDVENYSEQAYKLADAMLKQREL